MKKNVNLICGRNIKFTWKQCQIYMKKNVNLAGGKNVKFITKKKCKITILKSVEFSWKIFYIII